MIQVALNPEHNPAVPVAAQMLWMVIKYERYGCQDENF